jgi:hypothetical protein
LEVVNQRTQALETEIWGHLVAIVHDRPGTIAAALQASLNESSMRFVQAGPPDGCTESVLHTRKPEGR